MHRFNQRVQTFRKGVVTLAASEAPCLFEIGLGKTAYRAMFSWRPLFDLLRFTKTEQKISQREARRI
jgi:hypothetical protein